MTLASMVVPIPPAGGLTEQQGKYLPSGFHQLDNCVFSRVGQVEKRHGYGSLGGDEALADGVKHVAARGNELVMVFPSGGPGSVADPGHYLYSWSPALSSWSGRCTVPRLAVSRYPAIRSSAEVDSVIPKVCRIGDVEAYVYTDGTDSFLRIVDVSSGAVLLADTTLVSSVTKIALFANGTDFVFVWVTGAGSLRYSTYSSTTLTSGSLFTIALTAPPVHWDAVPTASGFFAFAASIPPDIQVKRVTIATGAVSTFTSEFARAGLLVALAYLPGYAFLSMAFDDTAGDLRCKKYTESTLATAVADWQVESAASLGANLRSLSVGVEPVTFRTYVAWTAEDTGPSGDAEGKTKLRGFTAAGVSLGAKVDLNYTSLQSRIFVLDGACYCAVTDYYFSVVSLSVQRLFGYALICLSRHPDQWDNSRPAALEGLLAPIDGRGLDAPAAGALLPFVPTDSTGYKALLPIVVIKDRAASDGLGSWADIVELDATVPGAGLWRSTEAQGLLHLGAALPTQYDGQCASEIGFVQPPQIFDFSLVYGATGLEGDAVTFVEYEYYAIWEWRDAAGNLHRSRRSAPYAVQVSHSGADTHANATLYVRTTGLTRRTDIFTGEKRDIRLKVFRTTPTDANDGNHYQIAWVSNVNVPNPAYVTVADTEDDLTLIAANRGQLYTDGGIVDNDTPPAAKHLCVHGGRVWLVSAEAREVWFSKYLVQGEAPAFSALMRITLDDSPDAPVACAPLGASLAILTESRIYVLPVNAGPADTAVPAYPPPDAIQTSWGCIDARSVLSYRDGVAFQSRDGLRLLTPGGDVVPFGDPVHETLAAYPTILGAVLDSERMRVLWLCSAEDGATIVICWDYDHEAWSTWSWDASLALTARAHCMWQGQHVLAAEATSIKGVWCESYGSYPGFDPGPTLPTWVTATIETPWIHLGAIGGYQRLWRLHLQLEKNSAHGLAVSFFVDGDDTTAVQTETWTVSQVGAFVTTPRQPLRVGAKVQKCSTVKIRVSDTETAVAVADDPTGFVYHELALQIGAKPGLSKGPKGQLR